MVMDNDIKTMAVFAAGLVVLAITAVIGIVVLDQFKPAIAATSQNAQINTTIDLFIAAIAVFGTFATIIALILIAKVILGLLRGGFGN